MRRKILSMLLVAALCMGFVSLAHSADELFDTKAAAKHTEKGIEYLKAKKYDAAIKEFDESVTINPDAEAYYYLGYAYYMKGKIEDGESRKRSKENFDKAYELDPNFTPSKLKLAEPVKPEPKAKKPEAPAAPQPKAEAEEPASKVFQGTAQPEQPQEQPTPPAPPAEQPREQPPQPPEQPKEQPPQQPEQPKPTY